MATKLPNVINESEIDMLREEYTDYQLADAEELPKDSEVVTYCGKEGRLEAAGQPRFHTLTKLMKALMVIPHSNALSERTFSMIRRIDTEFRSELAKDTIRSLLSCKMNSDSCCYDVEINSKVLKDCKSPTRLYNRSHKN